MNNIQELLMSRLGYSEQDVNVLCCDLAQLDQRLVSTLNRWIAEGDFDDETKYSGFSINILRSEYEMNFIAAILTLDWIIKDPEQALPALKSGIM